MGFGMGVTSEKIRLLQVQAQNREIPTNRDLPYKYLGQIDFLPRPCNDPIVILSISYHGDGVESILDCRLFQIVFPEITTN